MAKNQYIKSCGVGFQALLLATMPLLSHGSHETIVLDTGAAVQQTALLAGSALTVFSSNKDGSRHVQSWQVGLDETTPSSKLEALANHVILVDEIVTPEGTQIALISRDRANLLGSSKPLLQFSSIYNAPVYEAIPRSDVFRDLNGDGLDDFVIPGFDGFEVAVQRSDGSFTQPITLIAPPMMDMSYNSHPWYQAKSLFHADMTGDKRDDLVFWQEGRFVVYPQNDSDAFDARPTTIASDIGLDYDSVDGMSLRFSNEDHSDKSVTVIHSLADYDGDGITDLMAMKVKSEGVLNKKTTFSLHQGELAGEARNTVVFANQARSIVESSGIQYEMLARDLDADGDLDLMVSSVELGVGKIIGALLTSSIKIDLGFYPMLEGVYPTRPATNRTMTATFSLSSGDYWIPSVTLLDLNRDKLLDLLIQDSDEAFNVFSGEREELFANRGTLLSTPLPKDPDLIRNLDANRDGTDDLLIMVPPPLGSDLSHRVVLLLSKDVF